MNQTISWTEITMASDDPEGRQVSTIGQFVEVSAYDGNESSATSEDVYFPLLKQPIHMVIVYAVAYGCVFILGVLGNTMVVGVVYRNTTMHSVINYFIVNMAVADLLVSLICVPITLLTNIFSGWRFGAVMCKLTPFLQGVAVNASVNTLAAISIDRYLAICFPLEHRVTRRAARVIIATIWCTAGILISPWAVYYEQRAYVETDLQTIYVCGQFGWPNEQLMRGYFLGVVVLSCYTVPLLLITVCYTIIGCKVWNREGAEIANGSQEMMYRSKVRVLKMVAVVVAVFAFFWLPLYAITVRAFFVPAENSSFEFYLINQILLPPAQWLALSSSTVNPFIYWLFSARFRTGYRDLVVRVCCCCCGQLIEASILNLTDSSNYPMGRPSGFRRSPIASMTAANRNGVDALAMGSLNGRRSATGGNRRSVKLGSTTGERTQNGGPAKKASENGQGRSEMHMSKPYSWIKFATVEERTTTENETGQSTSQRLTASNEAHWV